MNELPRLHADIDARVQTIRESSPDWPCAKGCDGCCHSLADIPSLTEEEWALLKEGLAALPATQRARIGSEIAALAESPARAGVSPIACPFLDRQTGACPVYLHRPVACRTYGFYVQRDRGLYCREIESRVAAGMMTNVVWGNHDAVDSRLAGLGEKRLLTEWYAEQVGLARSA